MEGIMTSVKFTKLLTVLMAVALMLTLLTTAIYATNAESTAAPGTDATGTTDVSTEAEGTKAEGSTDSSSSADSETATTTTAPAVTTGAADAEEGGLNWDLIITLSVVGVAAIVLLVVYFAVPRFHAWTNKKCREIKSELKNVTWSPWRDVKRNTVLVIIIVVATAAIIGLLDLVFNKSISALAGLF
jgi:preprotein translocase SecE subunit